MSLAPALGAPLNCGTLVGATAPAHIFAKAPVASPRFRLRVTPITRVSTPASSATVTDKDRVVSRVTGDTLITDYEVAVEYLVPDTDLSAGLVFSSSNTATLQTPANNIAQAVAPGNVILKATAPTGEFAAVAASSIEPGQRAIRLSNTSLPLPPATPPLPSTTGSPIKTPLPSRYTRRKTMRRLLMCAIQTVGPQALT